MDMQLAGFIESILDSGTSRLQRAADLALADAGAGLIDDIIGYADVIRNAEYFVQLLEDCLGDARYCPEPIEYLSIPDGRKDASIPVVPLFDLALIYAAMFETAARARVRDRSLPTFALDAGAIPAATWPAYGGSGVAFIEGVPHYLPRDLQSTGGSKIAGAVPLASRRLCALTRIKTPGGGLDPTKVLRRSLRTAGFDHDPAFEKMLSFFRFWAGGENGAGYWRRFLQPSNRATTFCLDLMFAPVDRAMNNDGPHRYGYARTGLEIQILADTEWDGRAAIAKCAAALRAYGFALDDAATTLIATADLLKNDGLSWYLALSDPRGKVGAASAFVNSLAYEGKWELWGDYYIMALQILREAGDDSARRPALRILKGCPDPNILTAALAYLKASAVTHNAATDLGMVLGGRQSHFPCQYYYFYRLAAYERSFAPALKTLALYDALDGSKNWSWRAGAISCLASFSLSDQELEMISAALARETCSPLRRGLKVLLWQSENLPQAFPPGEMTPAGERSLDAYAGRARADADFALTLLDEIAATPASDPAFVDRLPILDLVKHNAALEAEVADLVESKIIECDLEWPGLLARLDGIRKTLPSAV
jgi:hypothetical protein